MKKFLLGALAAVAAVAPAQAAVSIATSVAGSTATFNTSAAAPGAFTFEGATPYLSGGSVVSGTVSGQYAEPLGASASNKFLNLLTGQSATVTGAASDFVSIYFGSIDTFNTISFYDGSGVLINSLTGSDLTAPNPANGSQPSDITNRYITFSGNGQKIGKVGFASAGNSFEVDNIAFSNAVPEPATWAMMLVGFGAVGSAMRRRRVMKPSFV